MSVTDVAMQSRCPTCLAEQYVMNVIAFSLGEIRCGGCGRRTTKMTRGQYVAALHQAREAHTIGDRL